jgi:phosphoribosylformylglycinamidine (FGAM) synthase PurS component
LRRIALHHRNHFTSDETSDEEAEDLIKQTSNKTLSNKFIKQGEAWVG